MTTGTSALTVDETVLLAELGFGPLSFVMGASLFHVGYPLAMWSRNQELDELSAAMQSARSRAMDRLLEQARSVDADGVVGVRIDVEHHGHNVEFVAMGTAVRAPSRDWRVARQPFTCDLSGQDFWALARAGYRPSGLVMGSCVYHVAHQFIGQWLGRLGMNCEMREFTQALYEARELAIGRMQADAARVDANGVVGVRTHEGSYGWHSNIIEFFAIGTAVVQVGAWEHRPITPILSAAG